jgi:hypothetical protein
MPGAPFDYIIKEFQQQEQGEMVVLQAVVEEGDTLTLYEPWPESAEVTQVTDETFEIRIDPPYEPGEPFTWMEHWPDATEIANMDDSVIELRHSPEVVTSYEQPGQVPGETMTFTVVDKDDETIFASSENPDPLAGESAILDLIIVEFFDQEGMMGAQP